MLVYYLGFVASDCWGSLSTTSSDKNLFAFRHMVRCSHNGGASEQVFDKETVATEFNRLNIEHGPPYAGYSCWFVTFVPGLYGELGYCERVRWNMCPMSWPPNELPTSLDPSMVEAANQQLAAAQLAK